MTGMKLYLVRHGENLMNSLKKNQGWIDSDLTVEGIKTLKNNFVDNSIPELDIIYCSDLGRTIKTLEVILPYLKFKDDELIEYSNLIRERFLGSLEGDSLPLTRQMLSTRGGYKNFNELIAKTSFWNFVDSTKEFDPTSLAENFNEFSERINHFLKETIKSAKEKNIAIF